MNPYPGAMETISDWARIDECSSKPISLIKKIDIAENISGAETMVSRYRGCGDRTVVERWSNFGQSPELRMFLHWRLILQQKSLISS